MLLFVENDNGRTVTLSLDQPVQITLPENAGTGYSWALDHVDKEFIDLIATEARFTKQIPGAAGEVVFIFQGKKAGVTEIVLKHWRQWEGDASVTARFRLQLHLQP